MRALEGRYTKVVQDSVASVGNKVASDCKAATTVAIRELGKTFEARCTNIERNVNQQGSKINKCEAHTASLQRDIQELREQLELAKKEPQGPTRDEQRPA